MNILVPTDFSDYAERAFDVACKLAKKFDGTLHLYHSAAIPDDWEKLPAETRYKDEINKSIAIAARDKMKAIKHKATQDGIPCELRYTGGKFLKNIFEVLEEVDIDLIVIGSHGVSGKEEWLIGSNTQKVIRKVHKNVLVVKNQVEELDFSKALFATGLHQEEQDSFRRFLEFLNPFNVQELHVMAVDTSGYFSQPTFLMLEALKDFRRIAADYPCKTHFYSDYSVESGIRHFTKEYDIKLIGISNHNRKKLKRIFMGSNVEMLINHASVPVLSIDYN